MGLSFIGGGWSAESTLDVVGVNLIGTAGIAVTYDDPNDTIIIDGSGLDGGGGGSAPSGDYRYRKFVSGRYYGGGFATLQNNQSVVQNAMQLTPLWVPHNCTIDRIGCEVTTAAAGATGRFGLYSNNDTTDLPDTLVAEFTGADFSTTGAKEVAISQALTGPGLYWLAFVQQGGTASFRGVIGALPPVASTTLTGGSASIVDNYYNVSGVSGSLPTTPSISQSAGIPTRMRVRVA